MKKMFFILIFVSFATLVVGEEIDSHNKIDEEVVKSGCIGECGLKQPIPNIEYIVNSPKNVLIIFKSIESSLCRNTGVYVFLFKNGKEVANGHLHGKGEFIQTIAAKGDKINAYIIAYPLFNGMKCIRQGNLKFNLIKKNIVKESRVVSIQ